MLVLSVLCRHSIFVESFVGASSRLIASVTLRPFIDVDLLLVVHHAVAHVVQASIPALAALSTIFGVVSRLDHIVVINELGATVDARPTNEQSVPVLLALDVHHGQLLVQGVLAVVSLILHAARSLIDLGGIHVTHHTLVVSWQTLIVSRCNLL